MFSQLIAAEFRDPLLPLWAMELLANVFLWVWLFCMGATVGSFLNVVVYRLPRGLNIVYPGSFCPHCGHAIRLQDNIPLLSWLNLRGRCRDCGGRISPRYFLVELTVAVAFLVVLAAECYLPPAGFGLRTRHVLHLRDGVPFWCMYFFHVALVTTLVGAVLLRVEGNLVPGPLFVPVIVVGLVLPLWWPEIRSMPAVSSFDLRGWQAGLVDGMAGLTGGLLAAVLLTPFARGRGGGVAAMIGFCCAIGVVLGWQRGMIVAAVTWPLGEAIASVLSRISIKSAAKSEVAAGTAVESRAQGDDLPVAPEGSTGKMPVPPEPERPILP